MSYPIKERMMRDKSNQDDSVTLGDSAVGVVDMNVSAKKEEGTEAPLFEAKKEKVEVAGYHLPAVVENEKSSMTIDRLPNEMLEKIFEYLIQPENDNGSSSSRKSELNRNNQSYLNCRLVSTRCKFWMESVLEKTSISSRKAVPISIRIMEAEPPALGHLFVHETEDEFTPVKWASLPPALESWDGKGSPFPSHSLKLTIDLDVCNHLIPFPKPKEVCKIVRLIDFFSKFGEHLTSLILSWVTLTPETFIGILGNTPNLKALNLMRVLFRGDLDNCAQLPALQHLKHLRVFYLTIMLKKEEAPDTVEFFYGGKERKQLYSWILLPFKQQLLTLDIAGRAGVVTVANFANLERLFIYCDHIYHVDDPSLLQPNMFLYPRLKSLFLMDVEIIFDRDIFEWFLQHIAPLADTLAELHLDTLRHIRGYNRKGPLFQLPPKSMQKKINEVVFRELKKLEITFPKDPEEVEVIKALIKMFPKLEALTFLDRRYGADAVTVVDREEYKKVCPTLKKIRIRDL